MMIIAAITGLIFFAIVAAIIYAVSRFAVKHDALQIDSTDHAPEAELDRHATSLWIGGNHFEF